MWIRIRIFSCSGPKLKQGLWLKFGFESEIEVRISAAICFGIKEIDTWLYRNSKRKWCWNSMCHSSWSLCLVGI